MRSFSLNLTRMLAGVVFCWTYVAVAQAQAPKVNEYVGGPPKTESLRIRSTDLPSPAMGKPMKWGPYRDQYGVFSYILDCEADDKCKTIYDLKKRYTEEKLPSGQPREVASRKNYIATGNVESYGPFIEPSTKLIYTMKCDPKGICDVISQAPSPALPKTAEVAAELQIRSTDRPFLATGKPEKYGPFLEQYGVFSYIAECDGGGNCKILYQDLKKRHTVAISANSELREVESKQKYIATGNSENYGPFKEPTTKSIYRMACDPYGNCKVKYEKDPEKDWILLMPGTAYIPSIGCRSGGKPMNCTMVYAQKSREAQRCVTLQQNIDFGSKCKEIK